MGLKNTPAGYGSLAKFFHWSIVLLFVVQFVTIIGVRALMWSALDGKTEFIWVLLAVHKNSGLLILVLGVPRFLWRKFGGLPDWFAHYDDWDKKVSHFAEFGLYTCIFVMTLSGLALAIAGGYAVPFFGLFHIDNLSPFLHLGGAAHDDAANAARAAVAMPTVRDVMIGVHVTFAFATVAFLTAHLTHVYRHHKHLKNGLLDRMTPGDSGR